MFIFRLFFKLLSRLFFLVILLAFIWYFLGLNDQKRQSEPQATPPSELDLETSKVDEIFIDKSDRKLALMANGQTLKSYSVALGSSPLGQKQHEGDGKTPTGEYVIDWRNDTSKFYRSLHISYPRPDQIKLAKSQGRNPGGMIMIHGQPNNSSFENLDKINKDWTLGCIALSNQEMDEIWNAVDNGTKITIIE